jgi:hypothetical protein
MAKTHPAVKKAQDAHKQLGDALTEIAQMMAARQQQAQPQPAPEPTAPGMTNGGVSPMGGQAR